MSTEYRRFNVTLRFQFPAWDERDGITIEVEARTKAEANKTARRQFERAGHIGCGSHQGRVTLTAVEVAP